MKISIRGESLGFSLFQKKKKKNTGKQWVEKKKYVRLDKQEKIFKVKRLNKIDTLRYYLIWRLTHYTSYKEIDVRR